LGTPVKTEASPKHMTFDPTGRYAYVVGYVVGIYSRDETGLLTLIGTVPTEIKPDNITFGIGGFVYVTNYTDKTVYTYSFNSDTGNLTFIGEAATGSYPQEIKFSPSGNFAYVPNNMDNTISVYNMNSGNGTLTPQTTISTGRGPVSVVFQKQ